MHNAFTFYQDNGTTYLLSINPSEVFFGQDEVDANLSLDGDGLISYQDSSEILGSFIWEAVPVSKTEWYDQIISLSGKTGRLQTNLFEQLVGQKNLLEHSEVIPDDIGTYWQLACSGDLECDGTTIGPDGVRLAYLYSNGSSATGLGCMSTLATDITFSHHNVLSCYVKEEAAPSFGINMYDTTTPYSHQARWEWVDGIPSLTLAATGITDTGVEKIGTDGWYRVWAYVNADSIDKAGRRITLYMYPNVGWSTAADTHGTYITDAQLEYDTDKPTYYVRTEGDVVDEPLNIKFLDYQIEQINTPGLVKHRITMNFKLTGAHL